MISRTRATVSSVWEVDGLPGWGSSSKDRRPLLKREYHSNVFDQLGQDSPKAACSILYVSAPFIPRRKQKSMHTRCCTFPSIVRCDAHCRLTFTERLPHIECREIPTSGFAHTLAQSCHVSHSVATSLHIIVSQKKISPGIKWSAHVFSCCCDHRGPPLGPILGWFNLLNIFTTHLSNIHFNIPSSYT